MQRYEINYFNEETVYYFGDIDDAIAYAESFQRRLLLTYNGSIEIADERGRLVATQEWVAAEDGSCSPKDWVLE